MPVKRRQTKRRMDPRAEAQAWEMVFTCGYDFFGELQRFGIDLRCAKLNEETLAVANEAWSRLGHIFMANWDAEKERRMPWAYDQFEEPGLSRY